VEFFKENRDLMEMVIPRSQKIGFELGGAPMIIKTNTGIISPVRRFS